MFSASRLTQNVCASTVRIRLGGGAGWNPSWQVRQVRQVCLRSNQTIQVLNWHFPLLSGSFPPIFSHQETEPTIPGSLHPRKWRIYLPSSLLTQPLPWVPRYSENLKQATSHSLSTLELNIMAGTTGLELIHDKAKLPIRSQATCWISVVVKTGRFLESLSESSDNRNFWTHPLSYLRVQVWNSKKKLENKKNIADVYTSRVAISRGTTHLLFQAAAPCFQRTSLR